MYIFIEPKRRILGAIQTKSSKKRLIQTAAFNQKKQDIIASQKKWMIPRDPPMFRG